MSRHIVVGILLAATIAVPHTADAAGRGLLGLGLGTVQAVGTPIGSENGPSQLFAVQGIGILGTNDWFALIGDFTIGLPRTYEGIETNDDAQDVEVDMFFFDALAGVYRTFTEGGFIYLGAGLALATANVEDTRIDSGGTDVFKSDFGTSLGVAFGLGLGLPINDDLFGTLMLRQRFVTAEAEISGPGFRADRDMSLGGLDVAVGIGFGFDL